MPDIRKTKGEDTDSILSHFILGGIFIFDTLIQIINLLLPSPKRNKSEEENIEAIQKFFGYSFIKAKETLNLLNDTQIDIIKVYLENSKGGKA